MSDQRLIINVATEIDELRRGLTEARNLTQEYATYSLRQIQTLENAKVQAQNQTYTQTKQIYDRAKNDLRQQYEEAKRLAQGNAQELLRIEQQYVTNRERMERESQQSLQQAQERQVQQGAQRVSQLRGRARRQAIQEELAEYERMYQQELNMAQGNAQRIAQLQSQRSGARRDISSGGTPPPGGGSAGEMGGMIKGAIGIGALVSVGTKAIEVIKDANAAYIEFYDAGLKVKTLLDDTQATQLPAAMGQLRDIAQATGQPVSVLSQSLYDVLSAIPTMSGNLSAATSVVESASKAAIGLGADTGSVVNAMTNLANASNINMESLANQNLVLDTMANTMKMGKVSAQDLAQYIAVPAPSMAALTKNADDSVKAIGAMYAQFTASGVGAAEASTQIRSLAGEMLKGDVAAKLLAAGVQGINPKGQVEDWSKVMQSMGKDTAKFVQIFGSAEAQNAVRILGKQGGESFASLIDSMNNAGGTAEGMYNKMAESGAILKQRSDAAWNDMLITIGESAIGAGDAWNQMTMSVAGAISSLFQTSQSEADGFKASFQSAIQQGLVIGTAIQETKDAMAAAGQEGADSQGIIAEQMGKIGEIAAQYKDQFPLIAADIQKIVNNKEGVKTVEDLQALNDKLKVMQGLTAGKAFLASFKQTEPAIEGIREGLSKIGNVMNYIEEQTEVFGKASGDIYGAINAGLENTKSSLSELKAEQEAIAQGSGASVEKAQQQADIQEQINQKLDVQNQLSSAQSQMQNQVAGVAQEQLQQEIQRAQAFGGQADLQAVMYRLQTEMKDELGSVGETNVLITETLREQLILAAEQAGQTDLVKQLKQEELQFDLDKVQARREELEDSGELTDTEADILDAKEQSLQAQLEQLDATTETIMAEEDCLSVVEETDSVKQDTLDKEWESVDAVAENVGLTEEKKYIEEGIADLTKDILNDNSLTTDQKIAQLEALVAQYNQQAQLKLAELNKLDTAKMTTDEYQRQSAELQRQIAILNAAAVGGQAVLADFKTKMDVRTTLGIGAPRRGGGGGGGRGGGSRERTEDREAEKAKKEAEKKERDAEKEKEKAAKESLKRQKELEKERLKQYEEQLKEEVKIHKQKIQEANDIQEALQKRKEAEEEMRKSILDFSTKLRDEISKDAVGQLSKGTEVFIALLDEFQKAELDVAVIRREYQDQLRDIEKAKKDTSAANTRAWDAWKAEEANLSTLRRKLESGYEALAEERARVASLEQAKLEAEASADIQERLGETDSATILRAKAAEIELSIVSAQAEVKKLEDITGDLDGKVEKSSEEVERLALEARKAVDVSQLTAEAAQIQQNMVEATLFVETAKRLAMVNKARSEIEQLYMQAAQATSAEEQTRLIEQAVQKQEALAKYMESNGLTVQQLYNQLTTSRDKINELIDKGLIKEEDLNVEVRKSLELTDSLIQRTDELGVSISDLEAKAAIVLFTTQLQEAYTKWLEGYKKGFPMLVAAVDAMNSLISSANQIDMSTSVAMEKARQDAISFYLEQIAYLESTLALLPQESAAYVELAGDIAEARKQLNLLQGDDSPVMTAIAVKVVEEQAEAKEKAAAAEKKAAEDQKTAKAKQLDDLNKMIDKMKKYTELVIEAGEAVKEIGAAFKTGKEGEGIEKIGDLTTKIGEALLNSGEPNLMTAGAVILGVGFFIKMFGKLVAVLDKEKSGVQIAKEKLDVLNEQVAAYNAQREIVDTLVALGDKELDTAQERLEVLREQTAELRKQNPEFDKYMSMSTKKLGEEKDAALARQRAITEYSDSIEDVKDMNEEDQDAWVRAAQEATGVTYDFGKRVTKSDLAAYAALLKEAGYDVEGTLTNINLAFEAKTGEIDGIKDMFDNRIAALDWVIQVSLDVGDKAKAARLLSDKLNAVRAKLSTTLVGAGIEVPVNIGTMTPVELLNFADSIRQSFGGEIPEEIQGLFDLILGTMKDINEVNGETTEDTESQADNRMRLLDHERKELEYKKEIGELDQAAYDKALEDLLLRKVNMQHLILNELIAQDATTEAILTAQEAIWDTEKEIYNLKHAQNAESDIALRKAQDLSRQRNAMVESMKAGGTYSAAEIKAIEDQIIATLREAGASEDQIMRQIETFRATLPRFAQGGYMPGGMVISDAGEFAVKPSSAASIERMYPGLLNKLNSDPLQAFQKLWAENMYTDNKLSQLKTSSANKGGGSVSFGNIYVSISGNSNTNGQQIANEIKKELDRAFQGRGIQLTQL